MLTQQLVQPERPAAERGRLQSQALATGQATDVSAVVTAVEQAALAMQLAVQVRNKAVDAYQEIIRMQIYTPHCPPQPPHPLTMPNIYSSFAISGATSSRARQLTLVVSLLAVAVTGYFLYQLRLEAELHDDPDRT